MNPYEYGWMDGLASWNNNKSIKNAVKAHWWHWMSSSADPFKFRPEAEMCECRSNDLDGWESACTNNTLLTLMHK